MKKWLPCLAGLLFSAVSNADLLISEEIEYLGKVPIGYSKEQPILGISAIRYDQDTDQLVLLSDDTGIVKNHYGEYGQARYYRVPLKEVWDRHKEAIPEFSIKTSAISEVRLTAGDGWFANWQYWLKDGHVDLEGLALTENRDLLMASEQGGTYPYSMERFTVPFLNINTELLTVHFPEFNVESKLLLTGPDGVVKAQYTFPQYFRNTCWKWDKYFKWRDYQWACSKGIRQGIQRNKGIESIDRLPSVSGGERYVAITEAPLTQDIEVLSKSMDYVPTRLLKFGLPEGGGEVSELEQYFYPFESLPASVTEGAKKSYPRRGVSDMVVLNEHKALVIERNLIRYERKGTANRSYTQLFVVNLDKFSEHSLPGARLTGIAEQSMLEKKPLLPTDELEKKVQEKEGSNLMATLNIEGVTFGPQLKDGSRLMILVNDNGASDKIPDNTWLLFFRLPSDAVSALDYCANPKMGRGC